MTSSRAITHDITHDTTLELRTSQQSAWHHMTSHDITHDTTLELSTSQQSAWTMREMPPSAATSNVAPISSEADQSCT